MKILITGATGLIGTQLGIELVKSGHEIVVISRSEQKAKLALPFPCQVIEADLMKSEILPSIDSVDAVIHLLGEGVADQKWSDQQKERILKSRTLSTQNLIKSFQVMPKLWIQASAIGIYGDRKDELLSESSSSGEGFLADVCRQWEAGADLAKEKGASRVVKARLGIVLSSQGGALKKMLFPFKAGVGGALSSGQQWMSWIHIDDVVGLFKKAIEDSAAQGPLNFVSPNPEINLNFSKKLVNQLNSFLGPTVPAFAMRLLFGEMADVLLGSQRVSADQAIKLKYQFKFPELQEALKDVLPRADESMEFFQTQQFVQAPRSKVFEFFSQAENLEKLTPEFLNFKIAFKSAEKIEKGSEIEYQLKVHGVPLKWKTLIEEFKAPDRFVDTALKSPYQTWHHTHLFEELGHGTLITDRVIYKLPVGYAGWLVGGAFVKSDLNAIFDFRRAQVAEIFKIT